MVINVEMKIEKNPNSNNNDNDNSNHIIRTGTKKKSSRLLLLEDTHRHTHNSRLIGPKNGRIQLIRSDG